MTSVRKILFVLSFAMLFTGCEAGGATGQLERATGSDGPDGGGADGGADGGGGDGGGGQEECAFTQGYWKNHPEAWPVSSLQLGTVTYTQAQLLDILRTPVGGNGLVALAHQLIAAELNVASGADDADIDDEIDAAHALIGGLLIPPIGAGYLAPSDTSSLVDALDELNNTGECKDGPLCGNGELEEGEECDEGEANGSGSCSTECKIICIP